MSKIFDRLKRHAGRQQRQEKNFWWWEEAGGDQRPSNIFSDYLSDIMNSDDPKDHHPRYETEPPVHTE